MTKTSDFPYINRELSWLDFNARVLEEAYEKDNPVLERFKFLGITASNLDEFFMVRVAGVREQVRSGYKGTDPAGLTPEMQLEQLTKGYTPLPTGSIRACPGLWSRCCGRTVSFS